ncbi:MAG: FAD-dependent oxidoreductase [Thermodesulfobacteriota bacterium]|nr:FAD-dependent oxidoreductase [Thermodesulfobacteriota bacterium]
MGSKKRVLIVGGVAGGASCAARSRRLSEEADIVVFEKGPYVSFANCGLPYYVGDIITEEEDLFLATPELFKKRFNIDVRVENQVLSIDREKKQVEVKNLQTGTDYHEGYDTLVLSPGAEPIRPPLPGIDLPGIFTLRTVPDSREIRNWIAERTVKHTVIVGGGFIGLEMAENLVKRGIQVTIVEMMPHVLPVLDQEMAASIHTCLTDNGVSLRLNDPVSGFKESEGGPISLELKSGDTLAADMVILVIGVRPDIDLAKRAGLEIGSRGGIRVDDQMRTSDERIWAVGDAVESIDFITGEWGLVPLAGPANRQGRIAADVIFGRDSRFRGVQGTAVCAVFDMTIALTGISEKTLNRLCEEGRMGKYEKVYLHPGHHVGYYPGSENISLKLLFSLEDGSILGAQAVGKAGVEKRIDVIAMAIQRKSTVFDLEEAELCYSPQFGAAKDPVNFAGMVAANTLRGDSPISHWEKIQEFEGLILDVRDDEEFKEDNFKGAMNIPLGELRQRMYELAGDQMILAYCEVGQRSYYATRMLRQSGFNVRNLSGGFKTFKAFQQCNKE